MGPDSMSDLSERVEKILDTEMEKALVTLGARSVEEMQSHLTEGGGVDTERLKGSLSFATARTQKRSDNPAVKEGDIVPPPKDKKGQKSLLIGTQAPYAKYTEWGSLPMGPGSNSSGSAEPEEGSFRDKILEWAIRKWGDSDETRDRAANIATAIAEEGTDAHPFFEPSLPRIRKWASIAIKGAVSNLPGMLEPTVTIVGPNGVTRSRTKAANR